MVGIRRRIAYDLTCITCAGTCRCGLAIIHIMTWVTVAGYDTGKMPRVSLGYAMGHTVEGALSSFIQSIHPFMYCVPIAIPGNSFSIA